MCLTGDDGEYGMPVIEDDLRTMMWIITGASLVLVFITAILIRRNIDYWVRRMIPQLHEKPPAPKSAKSLVLGGLFWLFLATTILGATLARPIPSPTTIDQQGNSFTLPTPQAFLDNKDQVPMRINIVFPPGLEPCNLDALTLIPDDVDPYELPPIYPIDPWFDRHEFVNSAFARISITNTAPMDDIQLTNRIITRVTERRESTDTYNAAYTICNAPSNRQFTQIDVQPGGQVSGQELGQSELITIKPWNQEVFEVELTSMEPGIYEVEVGVEFMDNDEVVQVWSQDTVLLHTPQSFHRWSAGVVTYWGVCSFESGQYECEELEYEEPVLVALEPSGPGEATTENGEGSGSGPEVQGTCRPAPPSRLSVGMDATVSYRLSLRLRIRESPGLSSNVITAMNRGTEMKIIEGPVCQDGYLWWKIQKDNGVSGWSAEGEPWMYYLEP
jgi:hypothetical protein